MEWKVEPEAVRDVKEGKKELEILVKWKHLPEFESSWEPVSLMVEQFPQFHLEDKVNLKGGNVKHAIKWVYKRKGKNGSSLNKNGLKLKNMDQA